MTEAEVDLRSWGEKDLQTDLPQRFLETRVASKKRLRGFVALKLGTRGLTAKNSVKKEPEQKKSGRPRRGELRDLHETGRYGESGGVSSQSGIQSMDRPVID